MTPITFCPPAPAHSLLPADPQFHKHYNVPVEAHAEAGGELVSSTGISFDDFSRMQCLTKKPTQRRKPIPPYATDPDAMRRLLVRFMEVRAFGNRKYGPMSGSDAYRLRRAHMKLMADVPRLDALATSLCHRYVEGKRNGADAAWLKRMESEIEGIDTQIIIARYTPRIVVGVIWRSYCLHEHSVAVAEKLGLKPPACRQLLNRLRKVWERLQAEDAPPSSVGRLPKSSPEQLEQSRNDSARWYASLTEEERSARMARNVARRRRERVDFITAQPAAERLFKEYEIKSANAIAGWARRKATAVADSMAQA